MSAQLPTPDQIIQLGFGFWGSKTLLSAIELGLFTELANGPLDAHTLGERLGLYPRSDEEQRGTRDFLDALVALKMLERSSDGLYRNTDATNTFLDRRKPSYVGGILEMANTRLYGFWGPLTEALRTDQPQNEIKKGENLFESLYSDQSRLEEFLKAMTGISMGAAMAIAQKFPWSEYRTMIDIGTTQGGLPVQVALAHQHLTGGGFDLPVTGQIFQRYVSEHGLAERLRFYEGDFFSDPLPTADVLVMGHILHDWNLDTKRMLLKKAHDALPERGALSVYEALIDDDRRANAFGLLMSLNMLIETQGGFDYTGKDCSEWMREAGFRGGPVWLDTNLTSLSGALRM